MHFTMAKRNQFSEWPNKWELENWQNYIPNMSFKVVKPNELPDFFLQNPITTKFNSAIVTCSGSTEAIYFGIQGLRPDNNNTVIDEDLYAVVFNKTSGVSHGGFLHHGDYPGRTTPIPPEITDLLIASGSTTDISINKIPDNSTGSLIDLKKDGLLTGTSKIFKRLRDEYIKK